MRIILEFLALIPLITFGSWSVGHHPFAVLFILTGSALGGFIYVLWGTSPRKSNSVDESIDLVKSALEGRSADRWKKKEISAESSGLGDSVSPHRYTANI